MPIHQMNQAFDADENESKLNNPDYEEDRNELRPEDLQILYHGSAEARSALPTDPVAITESGESTETTAPVAPKFGDASAPEDLGTLVPCAATASMFLYAQGTSVVCCRHDNMAIERRFLGHTDEIKLLAVDNKSENGAGRLVVSYDTGQNAIVWDLFTGYELAQLAFYDPLTVAVWMRNGKISFGNTKGGIVLFEPSTSEHLVLPTLDDKVITALEPLSDCQTFAIGYQNGITIIATLQPRFTVLHVLTRRSGLSPIVTVSWHASSTRRKSDLLAVQAQDGDLRVWSVPKTRSDSDPAKVVRLLKRSGNDGVGLQWMGWSKKGRIIQFSGGETTSWDVRLKQVTFESIDTMEHVRGITVYGPDAILFTLDAEDTVQKFELNSPPLLVASVKHLEEVPNELDPSIYTIKPYAGSITLDSGISESYEGKSDEATKVHEGGEDIRELRDGQDSEYGEDQVKSCHSSTFDADMQSKGTRPSTVPTSHPSTKPQASPQVMNLVENQELVIEELTEASLDTLDKDETEHQQSPTDDCDAETAYSVDSRLDDPKLQYLQVFAEQLVDDLKSGSADLSIEDIETEYLDSALKEFAWKLHGESSNPFEWEASVVFHRKRKDIVELLVSRPSNGDETETELTESSLSEEAEDEELNGRASFRKSRAMVMQWVGDVEVSPIAAEESAQPIVVDVDVEDQVTPQLPDYKEFIQNSEAYHWLLNKIRQHDQLNFEDAGAMMEIGSRIRSHLRAQPPLRKMSSRKPLSLVTMTFNFEWDPVHFVKDAGIASLLKETLPKVLCLTGSWKEAQALTVADYTNQTWPQSGQALISLLQELLSVADSKEYSDREQCSVSLERKIRHRTGYSQSKGAQLVAKIQPPSSCSISITGYPYFVSEIGQQLGWLASALRHSPVIQGMMACTPRVGAFQVTTQDQGTQNMMVVGSCSLSFDFEAADTPISNPGLCWGRLFCNPVLVRGYPIPRRSKSNTGLEIALGNMATIVGSNQVVQWDERVIMKGFSMLLVATLAASDVIVWHLLVSEQPGERIPYIDPRLDTLGIETSKISLRMIEASRHVIGWCSKVTDLCGDATTNHNVKTSGLKKPPASIIIDRLYLEAGADVVGGFNMSINKKEQPFWLERESDYPSLLKWMSVQPIVFYDVVDRRAWLIDGASALLHLVRISLYLDEHDPESTYDWVFDITKLKDKWDGLIGRQAALKTLKTWDNLDLNVYVTSKRRRGDGVSETEYSTLETRVKKILHSIEILIDRQVKVASQDGIRISQTLNVHCSIIGFDILDVLTPLGPIHPRIKHLDTWRHGWADLITSIGITTIFGSGFGNLIRPDEPTTVCKAWKSIPEGMDYMAASLSTLQMLYERRLLRMEPGLTVGHMTSKIIWSSPYHPFKPCKCLRKQERESKDSSSDLVDEEDCSTGPVQFLVKKSWGARITLRGMTPVNLAALDGKGAVVFGHIPFPNLKNEGKLGFEQREKDKDISTILTEPGSEDTLQPPGVTSTASDSAGSTNITVPSLGTSNSAESQSNESPDNDNTKGVKRKTNWRKAFNGLRKK